MAKNKKEAVVLVKAKFLKKESKQLPKKSVKAKPVKKDKISGTMPANKAAPELPVKAVKAKLKDKKVKIAKKAKVKTLVKKKPLKVRKIARKIKPVKKEVKTLKIRKKRVRKAAKHFPKKKAKKAKRILKHKKRIKKVLKHKKAKKHIKKAKKEKTSFFKKLFSKKKVVKKQKNLKKKALHKKSIKQLKVPQAPLNKEAFKKPVKLKLPKKARPKHYKLPKKPAVKEFMKTGIEGLDELLGKGVPKGAAVLLAGGAGSGKTIIGLQIVNYACKKGMKCLYMSFEESEERLRQHMSDFGWDAKSFESKNVLMIKRFNPFEITRSVDALLEKMKGELLIDVQPVILPDHFKPEIIVLDSLTAIASAFTGREESYRIYIEQLFRFLENIKSTSFLITETEQMPTKFSTTGVEEFLADGVIVLYAIKLNDIRENAIEVLKMRGVNHQKKIVAMRVIENKGVEVYPEQEVYASMVEKKE
ncbi:MAG: AAA family ATPase [Nanoarchaeota archaeon]|nr:AAA family ATPase [Nanoarchaeota archaeon]